MKLKWQQAPVKTTWGDEMMVASVAIDNDHTVDLYCERSQTAKVEAMFAQRQPLTDEEIRKVNQEVWGYVSKDHTKMWQYARAIEAAHGIKGEA